MDGELGFDAARIADGVVKVLGEREYAELPVEIGSSLVAAYLRAKDGPFDEKAVLGFALCMFRLGAVYGGNDREAILELDRIMREAKK